MNKSYRSNAQYTELTELNTEFRQQYCIINTKLAQRLDLNYSYHKKYDNTYHKM